MANVCIDPKNSSAGIVDPIGNAFFKIIMNALYGKHE